MPTKKASTKAAKVPPCTIDDKDAEIARLRAELAAARPAPDSPGRDVVVENITPNPLKFYVVGPKGRTEEFRFGPMPIPNRDNPTAPVRQIEGDTPFRRSLPSWAMKDANIQGALRGNPAKGFDPQLRRVAA